MVYDRLTVVDVSSLIVEPSFVVATISTDRVSPMFCDVIAVPMELTSCVVILAVCPGFSTAGNGFAEKG